MIPMPPPSEDRARRIVEVYGLLRGHFGYAYPWWPGTPLEVVLAAILVQQCDWSAAWAGVCRLRDRELVALPVLATTTPVEVADLIRGVAFAPTKSQRLVRLASELVRRGFRDVETYFASLPETERLRHDLLRLE